MLARRFTALLMSAAFASMVLSAPSAVASTSLSKLSDFCEIQNGAPISEKCIGFVSAIVEIRRDEGFVQHPYDMNVCIPLNISTKTLIRQIRPWLRRRGDVCVGHCDATSYVSTALNATYPCGN
jgi:hypothetical protein